MKGKVRQAVAFFTLSLIACVLWGMASNVISHSNIVTRCVERASIAERSGRPADAEKALLQALHVDPLNAGVYELLANHYIQNEQWGAAYTTLLRLGRIAPDTPHLYCRLATCALRSSDEILSYQLAQKELKRDANCLTALGIVEAMLEKVGQSELRLKYIQRMARISPNDPDVLQMLAENLAALYKYDDARAQARKLLALQPSNVSALQVLGQADTDSSDQPAGSRRAVGELQHALQIDPINGQARRWLGQAYLNLNDIPHALFQFEEAAREMPNNPKIFFSLGRLYRRLGRDREAGVALRRFAALQRLGMDEATLKLRCSLYPKQEEYSRRLGLLYLKLDEPDQALVYLNWAHRLKPHDVDVNHALELVHAGAVASTGEIKVDDIPSSAAIGVGGASSQGPARKGPPAGAAEGTPVAGSAGMPGGSS